MMLDEFDTRLKVGRRLAALAFDSAAVVTGLGSRLSLASVEVVVIRSTRISLPPGEVGPAILGVGSG